MPLITTTPFFSTAFTSTTFIEDFTGGTNGAFGNHIDVSDSGEYLVVAAPQDDTGGTDAGRIFVYNRSGGVYGSPTILVSPSPFTNDQLGRQVAINRNGTVILAGNFTDDIGGTDAGSMHVYTRSGSVWSFSQTITESIPANSDFAGIGPSLSADASTMFLTAHANDNVVSKDGSVFVFTGPANVGPWTQVQNIVASDGVVDLEFGRMTRCDMSGDHLLVMAETPTNNGKVYYFKREGSPAAYVEKQIFTGSLTGTGDNFGLGMDITADGKTAAIGGLLESAGGTFRGAMYIFKRTGDVWTETQRIVSPNQTDFGQFGRSISISSDGLRILTGAYQDDVGAIASGAGYIYALENGSYVLKDTLTENNSAQSASDRTGFGVASSNQGTYIVSNRLTTATTNFQGSISVYNEV